MADVEGEFHKFIDDLLKNAGHLKVLLTSRCTLASYKKTLTQKREPI